MPLLSWEVRPNARGVVVALSGELDIASAPDLRDALLGLVEEQEERRVVLDFSDLRFMDSTGLAVLVAVYKRLGAVEGRLVVTNASARIRRMFEIAGLKGYLAAAGDHDLLAPT